MASTFSTPGVYINEVAGFGNAVVPVATAVPAFIGYTPKAQYAGKSYFNTAQKITSFADFKAFYMLDDPAAPADPAKQYSPQYYLVAQKEQPDAGDTLTINGAYYLIVPDPNTIYYLYNSVRLFYENGGGDAYIVSVGTYGPASKKPMADPGANIVNPNVQLGDLLRGLAVLTSEAEPTMYICPDATLLSVDNNGTLMQSMLLQAEQVGTTMCLFDIIGGASPDPILYTKDIDTFRSSTGSNGLMYGASYYPFIGTTIMQASDIDFTNLFGGDTTQLGALINPPAAPNAAVAELLGLIQNPPATPMSNSQIQAALLIASPLYTQIVTHVLADANVLPPSGAMAGVYAINDNANGVWGAPANAGIVGAVTLPLHLNDDQQQNLNIDAVSGKSVNAIRFFNGQGILVWGARTLDGNSEDWRYISVRRTVTFIEQSVKLCAGMVVFEPNTPNTWAAVTASINSFLTDIWKQGGLMGASAAEAFQVNVGLGTTMTAVDVDQGYMVVTVRVAVVMPAEFIVITFQQEQAASG